MKPFVHAVGVMLITSCASVTYPEQDIEWVRSYQNEVHGELLADDPIVIISSEKCSAIAFPDGVEIEDTLQTDGIEIIRLYNRSVGGFAMKEVRKLGKVPSSEEALAIAEKYANTTPTFVTYVHLRKHLWGKCFYQEEGFTPLYGKMPIYRVTGERLKYDGASRRFVPRNESPSKL